jgi:hypothetical protein
VRERGKCSGWLGMGRWFGRLVVGVLLSACTARSALPRPGNPGSPRDQIAHACEARYGQEPSASDGCRALTFCAMEHTQGAHYMLFPDPLTDLWHIARAEEYRDCLIREDGLPDGYQGDVASISGSPRDQIAHACEARYGQEPSASDGCRALTFCAMEHPQGAHYMSFARPLDPLQIAWAKEYRACLMHEYGPPDDIGDVAST